jgi:hypothetical protein
VRPLVQAPGVMQGGSGLRRARPLLSVTSQRRVPATQPFVDDCLHIGLRGADGCQVEIEETPRSQSSFRLEMQQFGGHTLRALPVCTPIRTAHRRASRPASVAAIGTKMGA